MRMCSWLCVDRLLTLSPPSLIDVSQKGAWHQTAVVIYSPGWWPIRIQEVDGVKSKSGYIVWGSHILIVLIVRPDLDSPGPALETGKCICLINHNICEHCWQVLLLDEKAILIDSFLISWPQAAAHLMEGEMKIRMFWHVAFQCPSVRLKNIWSKICDASSPPKGAKCKWQTQQESFYLSPSDRRLMFLPWSC